MDAETAQEINSHLGQAFGHLQEAIMLALAGQPSEIPGGALGRLEKFVESGGDVSTLTEGLFDDDPFVVEPEAAQREYEDTPLSVEEMEAAATDLSGILAADQEDASLKEIDEEPVGDEESEFDGLFDDIDEEIEDEPGDAPAAF